MIIIPSIDIKDGKCTRLMQGDFSKTSVYTCTPEEMASKFHTDGASTLHVVDLDGAKTGKITQLDVIKRIKASFNGIVQVGGGIRTEESIESLLENLDRVVIGSQAVLNVSQTLHWLELYGITSIVLALDFTIKEGQPYLAIHGWQEFTDKPLWSLMNQYSKALHVLCTDITKDGMQSGPNFGFYEEFKDRYSNIELQASGGITSITDIIKLRNIGVSGAIIGKALYEHRLSLKEAIECSK